jgi:hypothetical protein
MKYELLVSIALIVSIAGWILLALWAVIPRFRWYSILELFVLISVAIEGLTMAASPLQAARPRATVSETIFFWLICVAPWLILMGKILLKRRFHSRSSEPSSVATSIR